ncbi:MAG: MFS transporter [Peptococcaceae bacterium]|nr:MFS transporter [Peptococcaceae bacterium]
MPDSTLQTVRLWTRNFFLLIVANFAAYVSFYMLIPSLPVYIKEITGRDALTGLAMGVFLLSAVLFRPFAGRLIDTGKRKDYFLSGSAIFFFSTLAFNLAPTLLVLLPARFVQGLGWAYCNTAAGTLVSDIIPKPRLAEGMGYYGLSLSVAMASGPALALFLMQRYNFQVMFYVCAGFVLLSFSSALLIKHQNAIRMTKTPLTMKTLLEKKALPPSLVMFFMGMCYAAVFSFLALYGQYRQVNDIGLFFIVYAISIAVSRPFFGRLADRNGYNMVMVSGLILCTLTLVIIYLAYTLPVFILAGLVYGIGFGAVQPTTQALSVLYVPPERRGAATATYFLFLDLGLSLGSVLWGFVAQCIGYALMYLTVIIPSLLSLIVYLLFAKQTKIRQRFNPTV